MTRKISGVTLLTAFCLFALGTGARADVIVSAGYYDLAPPAAGNNNALPNPWYGSANTSFFGDVAEATAGDPDESAILFTNTGTSAVTLDAGVTVTSGSHSYTLWDSFIGASGFVINPGQNVILAGTASNSFDGSDIPLSDSTITFGLNGTSYTATDSSSILAGVPGGNETEPWTQLADLLGTTPTSTPEPAGVTLIGLGLLGLVARLRQKSL